MMKYINAVLIMMMFWTMNVYAQEEQVLTQEHTELKNLLSDIEKAINNKDIDSLSGMMMPDVVVTFLNGEVVRNVDDVNSYFNKMLGGGSAILKDYHTSAKENSPAKIMGNIAIADGITNDEFVFANGSKMAVKSYWSTTVVKQDGQWKVAQLHFSTNMFDNPLVAVAERNITIVGVVAVILGIVIGFVVGRKSKK